MSHGHLGNRRNFHHLDGRDRLDRDFGRERWGDEGYGQEELVAELGAADLLQAA